MNKYYSDIMYITHQRGSFYKLNTFVDILHGMQHNLDLDVLIGLSGFKGSGKSTLSKQICRRYVNRYMPESKLGLKDYTAYGFDDLFRMCEAEENGGLPNYAPIDGDEAVNFALGEDWNSRNSKKLKKIFTKIRTKHHIFFFNIPSIWWLDTKYREGMMSMWLHIPSRGRVMMSLPNTAPGMQDSWHRKWLEQKFAKNPLNYFSDPDIMLRTLRQYPCFVDSFKFPKLPIRIYEQHLKLRNANITAEAVDAEKPKLIEIRECLVSQYFDRSNELKSKSFRAWYRDHAFNHVTGERPLGYSSAINIYNKLKKEVDNKATSVDVTEGADGTEQIKQSLMSQIT